MKLVDLVPLEEQAIELNETTEKAWNAVDVSRKAEKAISNKEWNERTGKKLDMLKKLNADGKFKKDFDEETLQGWVDKNYSWEQVSKKFKLNEGTCGYGPNGIPGRTPGETNGMPADDRIRGMLKMLIQKEVSKLKEQNFDSRLKSMMGDDDFEKATNPKLAKLINNAIMTVDPNMSYVDFAKGVAQVLRDEYNQMNQNDFIRVLRKELDI